MRTHGAMSAATTGLLLVLWASSAQASDPTVAVLPVTGDGVTPAMLDILQDTVEARLAKLGLSTAAGTKVSSAVAAHCADAACTTSQAVAVGKSAGASHVLSTLVGKTGDSLSLRMVMIDVASGAATKSAVTTDASGLLASAVKLLGKVVPDGQPAAPPPPVHEPQAKAPPPAPAAAPVQPKASATPPATVYKKPPPPATVYKQPEPAKVYKKPQTLDPSPAVSLQIEPAGPQSVEGALAQHVDDQYDKLYRRSTGLLAVGGLLTIGGVALTVTSVVLWKTFVDWQKKARDTQCLECIDQADAKIKKNAIITAVAAGVLLPGIITLGAGVTQRLLAVKLRAEAAALLPDLNLALAPGEGMLTATWAF